MADDETEIEVESVTVDECGVMVRAKIVASRHYALPGIIIELSLESFWSIVQTS